MLAIIVALPAEAISLGLRRPRPGTTVKLSPQIALRVAGVGPSRARAAAEELLKAGACAILSWGCSAGLTPQLANGALLLPRDFLLPTGARITADWAWWSSLHCLLVDFNPFLDTLAGSEQVLATPARKQALFEATGASAVDMESPFLADWAAERGLPFVAVRSVCDTVATAIPQAVLTASDEQGQISLLRLLAGIWRQPYQLKDLIELAFQFRTAHASLARVAARLCPQRFGLPHAKGES